VIGLGVWTMFVAEDTAGRAARLVRPCKLPSGRRGAGPPRPKRVIEFTRNRVSLEAQGKRNKAMRQHRGRNGRDVQSRHHHGAEFSIQDYDAEQGRREGITAAPPATCSG